MYRAYTDKLDENISSDEEDRGDGEDERLERYVAGPADLFKSKSLNELKPFYNDTTLDGRMAEIRKSIYYIRQHWDEFDTFLADLKALLQESIGLDFQNKTTSEHAERLFSTKRDWLADERIAEGQVTFDAVKLYTSTEGYNAIYSLSNRIFRQEDSIASESTIRSVVFLVELINIDLYNYCLAYPEKSNFEGVVYRGMALPETDIQAFRSLRNSPIGKRNIAVPLGLFSSSTKEKEAKRFIKRHMKLQHSDAAPKRPMIQKVHVIGLKQEYVDHYRATFPSSVLTTVCAVDIRELSRHKREREVLLRGPFFLVLDMYVEENGLNGQPCDVLEAVMLNANRDHISTSHLGEQDGKAREMFGSMVTVTRSEFAVKYCTEKGLLQDAEEYNKIRVEHTEKLKRLMNSN